MKLLNTNNLEQFDDNGGYYKGGECDVTRLYLDIVNHISTTKDIDKSSIVLLDDWQAGEICIYINKKWSGYLSSYQNEVDDNWLEYKDDKGHSHCDITSFDCPNPSNCPFTARGVNIIEGHYFNYTLTKMKTVVNSDTITKPTGLKGEELLKWLLNSGGDNK